MKYPLFDFDFVKIQEYLVDFNHADDRIRYLDYVIKELDKVTNPFQPPIGVDIFPVLELEKDYWEYAFRVQKSGTTPDFKEGDGIYKDELADDLLENYAFKLKFEKRESRDFEEDSVWEHYREQFTKRDGLMYLRWVLKEFLIAVKLKQKDGSTIKAKEFKYRLKIKITELEKDLGIENIIHKKIFNKVRLDSDKRRIIINDVEYNFSQDEYEVAEYLVYKRQKNDKYARNTEIAGILNKTSFSIGDYFKSNANKKEFKRKYLDILVTGEYRFELTDFEIIKEQPDSEE